MFVDCQNFAGSWGRHFVSNWFEAFLCKTIYYFFQRSWGGKFVDEGDQRNPRTSIPHEIH